MGLYKKHRGCIKSQNPLNTKRFPKDRKELNISALILCTLLQPGVPYG